MYDCMQKQANKQLEANLDNGDYDESQLIELKVPVNLPYETSWASYQRYKGEIELNGVRYKYVKRKLANDTLYLKCIPNTKEMMLQSAKDDFFMLANNLLQNSKSEKTDNSKYVFKNIQKVFDGSSFTINIHAPASNGQSWLWSKEEHLLSSIHLSPEQPPDYKA